MKKTLLYFYAAALGLGLLLAGCSNNSGQSQQGFQALPYPVVTVPTQTVTLYENYPTSLEGIVDSEIRAKTSGYITQVLVDAGQRVRKGQLLFKLETESLSQDADAAKARVNAAQIEVDKLGPLVEKNIISPVQLETAKAMLAQAKSNYNAVVANIGYSDIKSPVDGYVGSINFREGALVSPSTQIPLTKVADIERIYAFFSLNEKEYLNFIQNTEGKTLEEKIKNLPKVRLVLANGELYEEEGVIETINTQVNAATGAVSFRAVFPNPNHILSSGYSGRIQIPTTYTDAVVVPRIATFERQGITYVYKVQGDSLAISAPVEVTARTGSLTVVSEGVSPGDKIVAKGVGKIRNNTPVVAQPADFDSIVKGLDKVFK